MYSISNNQAKGKSDFLTESKMATVGLKDQDRLEGASNYVIGKARMLFLLDEYGQKAYAESIVAVPQDPDQ